MLNTGSPAPRLVGATASGTSLTLDSLRGKWVVVYFYPKDNTPACTREAVDFSALAAEFQQRNAVIIGVSRDSARIHAGFAQRQGVTFPLVADTDETWCKAFDVIHEKVLYGKRYLGIVRSTFLIQPDGKIARVWSPVKVPGHASEVLGSIPAA